MFMGVEHGGYIFASYLFTFIVLAGLMVWVRMSLTRQKTRLAELEARGATRRRRRSSTKGRS